MTLNQRIEKIIWRSHNFPEELNYKKQVNKILKAVKEGIQFPHIKCLKRCDDGRCDCIEDSIKSREEFHNLTHGGVR